MKKILLYFNFILCVVVWLSLGSCSSSRKISEELKETTETEEGITRDEASERVGENVVKVDKKKNKKEKKVAQSTAQDQDQAKAKISKIMVYLGDETVTKWKLISLYDQKAEDLYNNLPMMRFDEPWKQIYGTTGCNKFTAYYKRDSDVFSISRVSATGVECSSDKSNEALFLSTLEEVNEINEEGDILSLLNNGQMVLMFQKFF